MKLTHQLPPKLKAIREKIIPILKPYTKWIALFGSMARGESTHDSDIDILVALKPIGERPVLGFTWFTFPDKLEKVLGCKVDLITDKGMSPYMRLHIEKDLVMLYEEK
ncbi:MAG: hypothetical protein B6242_16740 [Anaerolineaceae bacterium 4572_78]|nr:MAG: hypothetical protein B6242_16740 [Anaerolineaceae bacterium 4572_78]